jgi:probable HAF family extracellular repeat protein
MGVFLRSKYLEGVRLAGARGVRVLLVASGALMVCATHSWSLEYRIEPLGFLGGGFSRARAINNQGLIAGEATLSSGYERGFEWSGGSMSELPTLGGLRSRAMDVGENGHIAGWANSAAGVAKPAIWQNGVPTELPTLGGAAGTAWGVNASGTAVGNSYVSSSVYRATRWTGGQAYDLGTLGGTYSIAYDLNVSGQIVGGADAASGTQHAALWVDDSPVDLGGLSGGSWQAASGINDAGQIILWGKPAGSAENHAGLWSGNWADPVVDLGTFGGGESWAYGLNNHGHVVGWAELSAGYYHAFVYDGSGLTDLGTLGGLFSSAYGINDAGVIVGYAQDGQGRWNAVQWVPVPEPGAAVMALLAFGCALARRRGRVVTRRPRSSFPVVGLSSRTARRGESLVNLSPCTPPAAHTPLVGVYSSRTFLANRFKQSAPCAAGEHL